MLIHSVVTITVILIESAQTADVENSSHEVLKMCLSQHIVQVKNILLKIQKYSYYCVGEKYSAENTKIFLPSMLQTLPKAQRTQGLSSYRKRVHKS